MFFLFLFFINTNQNYFILKLVSALFMKKTSKLLQSLKLKQVDK